MTTTASAKERLTDAAFALFDERGFDATTVDDIAQRAGVGRTTFFRLFRGKEDVIFPDHDQMLAVIGDRLKASTSETAVVAVAEAARLVLLHYLAEGSLARSRYRLTSMVQALRDREIAGQRRYQRAFRVFIHTWMGGTPETALSAELMANAVVTTHNHVLRQWLREKTTTPEADFDLAMARTVGMFDKGVPAAGQEASLVVLRTTKDLHEILPMLRKFTS